MVKTILLTIALGLGPSVGAWAQGDGCKALESTLKDAQVPIDITPFAQREKPVCRIDQGCLEVDWNVATKQQLTETLAKFRFTEKTPLKVQTTNLNFLQYTVKWTQTVERQDKAFESVSGLFEKVFPLLEFFGGSFRAAPEAGGPGTMSQVEIALGKWVVPLEQATLCLSETVAVYTSAVLDKTGSTRRERLYYVHEVLEASLPELAKRRLEFLDEALKAVTDARGADSKHLETYWKLSERQGDLQSRLAEFLPLAESSYNGIITTVGSVKRNSYVEVTGQAAKRSSAEPVGAPLTPRYFVAWSRPLIYHVGYGYGRIRDIDFKQVRALSGQDVFTATKPKDDAAAGSEGDEEAGPESVAFMTLELFNRGPNGRYGGGFTLGTGLNAPGESLYAGGSLRVFSRVLLTGGFAWARATRGEKPLVDAVGSAEPRAAFAELTTNTTTKPFFSLSFKVY